MKSRDEDRTRRSGADASPEPDGDGGRLLMEAWDKVVRRRSGDVALVEAATGKICTFRELDERATAWWKAQALSPESLAGRAVVFAVPNGIEWMAMFIGLQRAGAVAVPLDAAEPVAAWRRVAERLRARYWWDGEKLVGLARARRYRGGSACLIKLTSGSTGEPRPLVFGGAQMLADARQVTRAMGIRPTDLNYALIPFGHSYGLGNLSIPLIAQGVPIVCGTAPLPQVIADDFVRWRPTVLPGVPAVFRAVAAAVASTALASLRLAISAGAPLPVEVARDFAARFGRRLHGFYGSSETGGIAYDRSGAASLAGSVGPALPGVEISLLAGRRLRVASPAVFTTGNRSRIDGVGCWTMPDRATVDPRGWITLLGRRGATVKIAGRRVNLTEAAARLKRLPGVGDVWVGVSAGPEPVLGAAVESTRTSSELRTELQVDTAGWKIPKKWAAMPALPLTSRGKIDTRALRRRVFGEG